ncbi:amidase [Aquamicrobium segne]|uniref:Amidase n=1 Tax=Aquamicrobium segne TaxID=469547 RepID=A0ABW0GTQ1_9HYPH
MSDLHFLELLELTELIHAGKLSPVEVVQDQLQRIETVDATISSYVAVSADSALQAAREAEAEIKAGKIKGPLHGAPVAVKDLCWTTDAPTAAGTVVRAGFMADEDATVVRRLREAGAILLGKLALTEGAYTDHHPDIAAPKNPWGHAHWVGASSSGSGAAAAAGLCYAAIGTDTGGSIRFPSGANGITGLKGSWGRVSRHGVFALAPTMDHVGPMVRSARDAAAVMAAIAGADEQDPTALLAPVPDYLTETGKGVKGLRLGIDAQWLSDVDGPAGAVLDEVKRIAGQLGMELVEVKFPDSRQIVMDWFPQCGSEVAVEHEQTYPSRQAEYGPSLAGLIELGRGTSGLDYQKLVLRRLDFTGRVRRVFEDVDLLLAPVQGFSAPTCEWMAGLGVNVETVRRLHQYTSPFDSSGNPTITLPGGFTKEGLPIGFQFIAGHLKEDLLLRAGVAYQQETDWHRKHPKI